MENIVSTKDDKNKLSDNEKKADKNSDSHFDPTLDEDSQNTSHIVSQNNDTESESQSETTSDTQNSSLIPHIQKERTKDTSNIAESPISASDTTNSSIASDSSISSSVSHSSKMPSSTPAKINDDIDMFDDGEDYDSSDEVRDIVEKNIDIEQKITDLIATGRMFKAHVIAKKAYQKYPENPNIAQAYSLVLLKTGAFEESRKLLYPILGITPEKDLETGKENISLNDLKNSDFLKNSSPELMANVGYIFRESWKYSKQCRDLEISKELYRQSFQKNQRTTTGMNAAWNAWLTGDDELAKQLAEAVLRLLPPYGLDASFRELVDLAEAQLLLGREDDACKLYEDAVKKLDIKDYISVVTARQQLYFLREAGFKVPEATLDVLVPPTIVVFTGHSIDHPSFKTPLFPLELEADVSKAITEELQSINARIGYCSASCGADILFIEAMQKLGGEVNIILPFAIADFIETNVRHAGPRWEKRFEKAIENAHSVSFACEDKYLGHDMLYRFSNHVMHGSAVMRGKFLTAEPHLMAVWHSRADTKASGPTDFIDRWTNISTLHLIDLDELINKNNPSGSKSTEKLDNALIKRQKLSLDFDPFIEKSPDRVIRSMMFSDLSGYSKLRDEHVPAFLDFLERLHKAMDKIDISIESVNTWGDAVFAVADSALKIADFGLRYCDLIEDLGKKYPEFPFPIRARISLHSGPVFIAEDPFIKKTNFYGGHINRAARLEPVTAVGQVYATQQFIAMLYGEINDERNECLQKGLKYFERYSAEYVGTISLAKSYGQQEVYHLRWNM